MVQSRSMSYKWYSRSNVFFFVLEFSRDVPISSVKRGRLRHVQREIFLLFLLMFLTNFYTFFFDSLVLASPCDAPPAYSPLPSRPRPQASLQFEWDHHLFSFSYFLDFFSFAIAERSRQNNSQKSA